MRSLNICSLKEEAKKAFLREEGVNASIDGSSTIRRRPLLLIANYSLLINCAVGVSIGRTSVQQPNEILSPVKELKKNYERSRICSARF